MERFNFNTWLQDKSRKIVTRDGKQARIICYDVKQGKQDDCDAHIIALVDKGEEIGEMSYYYSEDGRFLRNPNQTHNLDLFFADEEEELTELQKTLEEDCDYYVKLYNDGNTREELREWIKCWCHRIIDLARKEIEKENPYSGNQNQEWSEEDKNMLLDIINDTEQGALLDKEQINWLKSLKDKAQPQPKQEWSEEDEKLYTSALWHIKNSCGNGGKDSGEYEVYNWLKSIKDRIQPQPKLEWSKEEEERLITDYLKFKGYEDDSIWFKSFKDRVQPKQEWSEKDEHCIELLLPIIDSSSLIPKNRKKCKEFLKSLKDRVQPQPEKKWNKEDEFMLTRCIGILGKCYMGELPTKVEEELVWLISVKELIQI